MRAKETPTILHWEISFYKRLALRHATGNRVIPSSHYLETFALYSRLCDVDKERVACNSFSVQWPVFCRLFSESDTVCSRDGPRRL